MNVENIQTVELHILDAGKVLGDWSFRIRAAFGGIITSVSSHLFIQDIDVVAYASKFVIPEIGMNAYTENGNLIRFWLDPSHVALGRSFERSFPALMAHEMHHAIRARPWVWEYAS